MDIIINHPINFISAIGLLLDFVGVIYLFKYGLPSEVQETTQGLDVSDFTQEEKDVIIRKNKFIKRMAYRGLYLVIFGFLFQLLGVVFKTV